jgi:DNA invertase Pin-like site-specific DNA recombinase
VTIHGYARVSTADQNPDAQLEALRRAGAERIFVERRSGKSRNGRRELAALLASIRRGDVLVVTKLDRIGRSLRDLANIAHEIESAGAHLRVLDQNVDTSTSAGRAFFGMIATFAQFELDIRAERQRAGMRPRRSGAPTSALSPASTMKKFVTSTPAACPPRRSPPSSAPREPPSTASSAV